MSLAVVILFTTPPISQPLPFLYLNEQQIFSTYLILEGPDVLLTKNTPSPSVMEGNWELVPTNHPPTYCEKTGEQPCAYSLKSHNSKWAAAKMILSRWLYHEVRQLSQVMDFGHHLNS